MLACIRTYRLRNPISELGFKGLYREQLSICASNCSHSCQVGMTGQLSNSFIQVLNAIQRIISLVDISLQNRT